MDTMDRRCPRCGFHDFDFMFVDQDIESGVCYTAYHEATCPNCGKVFGYAENYSITGWETYDLETGATYLDSSQLRKQPKLWGRS